MKNQRRQWPRAASTALFTAAALLAGCGGSDDRPYDPPYPGEAARPHDERKFIAVEQSRGYTLAFKPLADTDAFYGRYRGIHGEAAYRIEVPHVWNGMLVMYAHGYAGEGEELTVSFPSLRQWLIDNGYAWAASSYSANYYDVRAGIEDTNKLANEFVKLVAAGGRTVSAPGKIYITGHSMGGHVAAAAVEEETYASAVNKVRYHGAVPMCAATGDVYQFEYLMNVTFAAQHLAAQSDESLALTARPATNFDADAINAILWDTVPTAGRTGVPSEAGEILAGIVRNLSGGPRPAFEQGFRSAWFGTVMSTGGRDGTVDGILAKDLTGNIGTVYQFDDDVELSAEERQFNSTILRVAGDPNANAPRRNGLRWIPLVNAEFQVPVVTLHGLGDPFVPFKHQQIYRQRAERNGSHHWLVQRAIRAPGHCDFALEEEVEAFKAMLQWEQQGVKPAGDDVLDPATVRAADYGCAFTRTPEAQEVDSFGVLLTARRADIPPCPGAGEAGDGPDEEPTE